MYPDHLLHHAVLETFRAPDLVFFGPAYFDGARMIQELFSQGRSWRVYRDHQGVYEVEPLDTSMASVDELAQLADRLSAEEALL